MLADEKGLKRGPRPSSTPRRCGYFIPIKSRINIGITAICIPGLITRGAPAVLGAYYYKVIFHLRNAETRGQCAIFRGKKSPDT